ncbi:hypothetical protein ACTXT7_013115 [Hymenolepis weldensis]
MRRATDRVPSKSGENGSFSFPFSELENPASVLEGLSHDLLLTEIKQMRTRRARDVCSLPMEFI